MSVLTTPTNCALQLRVRNLDFPRTGRRWPWPSVYMASNDTVWEALCTLCNLHCMHVASGTWAELSFGFHKCLHGNCLHMTQLEALWPKYPQK